MIKFKNEPETWKRLDYKILTFNCAEWNDKKVMHNSLYDQFAFPSYYGHNWDALQECLNEIEIEKNGLVVIFDNFNSMNIKDAHTLIDVFVSSAQRHLIFSERLLVLVKVENRNFSLNPFGANNFFWY